MSKEKHPISSHIVAGAQATITEVFEMMLPAAEAFNVCPNCLAANVLNEAFIRQVLHQLAHYDSEQEFVDAIIKRTREGIITAIAFIKEIEADADPASEVHSPTHRGPRTRQ